MTATAVPRSPGTGRRAAVLQALDESGPATVRSLASALSLSGSQVRPALDWLEGACLATHSGSAHSGPGGGYTWSVTDEGRERRRGDAPDTADRCFRLIAAAAAAGRPADKYEIQRQLGEQRTGHWPFPLVEDALAWLSDPPHAVIAPAGRGRWALTGFGQAAAAVSDDPDIPVWLRALIVQDRETGEPGMSAALADAILAFAGPRSGWAPDPGDRRLSWSVVDTGFSEREISWEQDPATGQWTFRVRARHGGQWQLTRETRTLDPVLLAIGAQEAAEPSGPCPPLADIVARAIASAAGPVTSEDLQDQLDCSGQPWTPDDLQSVLLCLSAARPRAIARAAGRWRLAPAGRAALAMPGPERAPLGLRLALLDDQRHDVDGMSARTAAELAACTGAGSVDAPWPEEVRRRWAAADGPRTVTWERDPAPDRGWTVLVTAGNPSGTPAARREARAADVTELVREIRRLSAQPAALDPRAAPADDTGPARPRPDGTVRRQPRRAPSRRERRAKGRRG